MNQIFSVKNRFYLLGAILILATASALIFNSLKGGQSMAMQHRSRVKGTIEQKLAYAILVLDNENQWHGVSSETEIAGILGNLEIPLYPEDLVNAFPDPKLKLGTTITIKRAPVIFLVDGIINLEIRSWAKDIRSLLEERELTLGPMDRIEPPIETALRNQDKIIITRVGERDESVDEIIEFQHVEQLTSELYKGETRLEQRGKDGRRIRTFRLRYENNMLVSRVLINEEIIVKAQPEIRLIGTRPRITVRCRYNDTVEEAAAKYGVDANSLCRTMMCESNGNANSIGYCGDPAEPCYFGLYQYTQGFWGLVSSKAGYSGANIFNPTAQIFTTAWAWSHGYRGRWPNC